MGHFDIQYFACFCDGFSADLLGPLKPYLFDTFDQNPLEKTFLFSPNNYPELFDKYDKETMPLSLCLSKRELNISSIVLLLNGLCPEISKALSNEEKMELERYTDSKEGFTVLRPSSWIKVDKAGATLLFEQPSKGANNVGVVVNPVRLTSLGEFGTPQFVAEKLIQAEKRKESTIDAELIGVAERSGQGGLQVYEFEYKIDSSRGGIKRVFSAAFVSSRKLYLLNINHSDKPESPLDTHTRMVLEEVLHSFDSAPLT